MDKYKKATFILVPVVCVLLVAVIVLATLYFIKPKETVVVVDGSRVMANAYDVTLDIDTREKTDTTIKEYSAANQADMLYFDWYEDEGFAWVLDFTYPDESGGVYCFKESIGKESLKKPYSTSVDITVFNEGCGVDFCEEVVDLGVQTVTINDVQVNWVYGVRYLKSLSTSYVLYAKINYGGYLYFIELEIECDDCEYALQTLETAFH